MPADASLLVFERILGASDTDPLSSAESDIAMLVLLGGKERTREDFAALFEAAGLTLTDIVCTPTAFSLLIARPA